MPWCTSGAHFVHQIGAKMGKVRANAARRRRIGRVSIYPHRRRWWVYYREHGQPARKAVADDAAAAEEVAAQINLELTASAPTLFSFRPVSVAGLQKSLLRLPFCWGCVRNPNVAACL
jgi:hypothetical protein